MFEAVVHSKTAHIAVSILIDHCFVLGTAHRWQKTHPICRTLFCFTKTAVVGIRFQLPIIEYLDEIYPGPKLLPEKPYQRYQVRSKDMF